MQPRIARTVAKAVPRVREGMSTSHLALLRTLPCCLCGRWAPSEAHHLLAGLPADERGVSRKASDRWAISLCAACHRAVHAHGNDEVFMMQRGFDGRAMAAGLWRKRASIDDMHRLVMMDLLRRSVTYG